MAREIAVVTVERELGPIDLWVNNAFVGVFGYVHGTMAALRRMRPRDSGVIIQVGSALAYRGIPLQALSRS
jgi:NAD(P)-dependent dehydrogenase (short-subunit alcohol dehydrogenase family)